MRKGDKSPGQFLQRSKSKPPGGYGQPEEPIGPSKGSREFSYIWTYTMGGCMSPGTVGSFLQSPQTLGQCK